MLVEMDIEVARRDSRATRRRAHREEDEITQPQAKHVRGASFAVRLLLAAVLTAVSYGILLSGDYVASADAASSRTDLQLTQNPALAKCLSDSGCVRDEAVIATITVYKLATGNPELCNTADVVVGEINGSYPDVGSGVEDWTAVPFANGVITEQTTFLFAPQATAQTVTIQASSLCDDLPASMGFDHRPKVRHDPRRSDHTIAAYPATGPAARGLEHPRGKGKPRGVTAECVLDGSGNVCLRVLQRARAHFEGRVRWLQRDGTRSCRGARS